MTRFSSMRVVIEGISWRGKARPHPGPEYDVADPQS